MKRWLKIFKWFGDELRLTINKTTGKVSEFKSKCKKNRWRHDISGTSKIVCQLRRWHRDAFGYDRVEWQKRIHE